MVGDQADDQGARRPQRRAEILRLELERDAEHDEAEDAIQQEQRLRIEVEANQIDIGHGSAS